MGIERLELTALCDERVERIVQEIRYRTTAEHEIQALSLAADYVAVAEHLRRIEGVS